MSAVRLLTEFRGRLLYPTFPPGLARQSVEAHLRHVLSKLEQSSPG